MESERVRRLLTSRRGLRGPVWPWSASPAPRSEQPLQVLASRDQQRLDVDLPELTKPESTEAVPVLRFAEQWLDPDLPLGHRLLVGSRLMVGADAFEILGVERSPY